jgi:hypothetical protein
MYLHGTLPVDAHFFRAKKNAAKSRAHFYFYRNLLWIQLIQTPRIAAAWDKK